MKCLIVEDDFISKKVMEKIVEPIAVYDSADNGFIAFDLFIKAHNEEKPYDLILLDMMMPEMDGLSLLKKIRTFESENEENIKGEVKIIMTTALDDRKNVTSAFKMGCEAYIVKPIQKNKLFEEIKKLGFNIKET